VQDVDEYQTLGLPLWLASELTRDNFVLVKLPRVFSRRVRDTMLAAPDKVALRERSPYFYEVGLR